jgi:hypothetical protein
MARQGPHDAELDQRQHDPLPVGSRPVASQRLIGERETAAEFPGKPQRTAQELSGIGRRLRVAEAVPHRQRFLQHAAGSIAIALHQGQIPGHPHPADLETGRMPGPADQPVEEPPSLREVPPGLPVQPQVTRHPQPRLSLAGLGQAELQCRPHIVVVGIQPVDPLDLPGAQPFLPCVPGRSRCP